MRKIYRHKNNKDTGIEIVDKREDGTATVVWYNLNYAKISGKPVDKCELGYGNIKLRPMDEYEIYWSDD